MSARRIAELVEDVREGRATTLGSLAIQDVKDGAREKRACGVPEVARVALGRLSIGVDNHACDALRVGDFVRGSQADGR